MYIQDPTQQLQELKAISSWRTGKDSTEPSQDLVALAISGGGIRSATFGLGVLERLKEIGLLERIDYLSTVSGGGYIGAWLSANCMRRQELQKQAPPDAQGAQPQQASDNTEEVGHGTSPSSWLSREASWDKSIDHLRRYSKYLSPEVGLLSADTWTMGTIWLRNALLTQTIIVLMIAALLLFARVMHRWFELWPLAGEKRWLAVILFSAAAGGIARNQQQLDAERGTTAGSHTMVRYFVGVACAIGAFWISCQIPEGIFSDNKQSQWSIPIAILSLMAGYLLMPAVELCSYRVQYWFSKKDQPPMEKDYGQGAVQRFVIVPMVAVGFLLGAVLWGQSIGTHGKPALGEIQTYGGLWLDSAQYWELSLLLAFGALSLFACRSTNKTKQAVANKKIRDWLYQSFIVMLATVCSGLVLHSLMALVMFGLNSSHDLDGASWRVMVWAPPAILFSFSLSVVMLIGIQGVNAIESVREWWSRMGAWLCIYGMAWMIVMTASVYGPWAGAFLFDTGSWKGSAALLTSIATTVGGILAGKSAATGSNERAQRSPLKAALNAVAMIAPLLLIAGLLIAVATGVSLVTTFLSSNDFKWTGFAAFRNEHWCLLQLKNVAYYSEHMLVVVLIALVIMAWRVDINEFSLNAFYRNRLARCYLGATRFSVNERHAQRFIGFDPDDDLPLAELGGARGQQPGPFHIFNCALNLGGSSDLSVHTRHSASFTLTPHFVGSRYTSRGTPEAPDTGCASTAAYGGKQQLTVAKAMAVSGAAASPNMGFHTSPLVAFALTFFNVRLGWWFPTGRIAAQATPTFGLMYLIKEMLGLASSQSDFLMISDGGHFENLGAYELVGRRCRVIIVSDAECDPHLSFESLGNLIRMCKVDHNGTIIEIDVKPIIEQKKAFAIGTITYPAEEQLDPGILIYIKASMTGDEGAAVSQYKAIHQTFPHESTGNQFYGEDQFESYRSLGYAIAKKAMAPISFSPGKNSTANALLRELKPDIA